MKFQVELYIFFYLKEVDDRIKWDIDSWKVFFLFAFCISFKMQLLYKMALEICKLSKSAYAINLVHWKFQQ